MKIALEICNLYRIASNTHTKERIPGQKHTINTGRTVVVVLEAHPGSGPGATIDFIHILELVNTLKKLSLLKSKEISKY